MKRLDYQLGNGEVLHAEKPRSFFIPERAERDSQTEGAYVKLLFKSIKPKRNQPGAERMWVEVLGRDGELPRSAPQPTGRYQNDRTR